MDEQLDSFENEFAALCNKYGIQSSVGFLFTQYDRLLAVKGSEQICRVPKLFEPSLRRLAAAYLETESLGEVEREHLEKIENGWLPEPFMYGEV